MPYQVCMCVCAFSGSRLIMMVFAAGTASRPGKVIGSVLRYNNCGATAASAEATEQRKVVRNPGIPAQYLIPSSSYPRKHPSCKNERGEDGPEASNGMQPKPDLYVARKVAAQGGNGSHWY